LRRLVVGRGGCGGHGLPTAVSSNLTDRLSVPAIETTFPAFTDNEQVIAHRGTHRAACPVRRARSSSTRDPCYNRMSVPCAMRQSCCPIGSGLTCRMRGMCVAACLDCCCCWCADQTPLESESESHGGDPIGNARSMTFGQGGKERTSLQVPMTGSTTPTVVVCSGQCHAALCAPGYGHRPAVSRADHDESGRPFLSQRASLIPATNATVAVTGRGRYGATAPTASVRLAIRAAMIRVWSPRASRAASVTRPSAMTITSPAAGRALGHGCICTRPCMIGGWFSSASGRPLI